MKFLRLAAFLVLGPAVSLAEGLHWYEIAVAGTEAKFIKSIVGSSAQEPEVLALRLTQPQPIVLENLREAFNGGYQPNESVVKVYIPTKTILYLNVLPGDPAAKK